VIPPFKFHFELHFSCGDPRAVRSEAQAKLEW
jgi:hypothetical protein